MGKVLLILENSINPVTGEIDGGVIQPIGIRVGPVYSGSGFRNSFGDSTMRRPEHAVRMAQQIVDAVNAAGGLEDDPLMDEYEKWCDTKAKDRGWQ